MSFRKRWLIASLLGLLALLGLAALVLDWSSPGYAGPLGSLRRSFAKPEPRAAIGFRVVGRGFKEVTDIQFVPGRSKLAVVLQKGGTARVVSLGGGSADAARSPIVFQVEVRTVSEMGLLGLAFSPGYNKDGLFYVNDNPDDGEPRTRISEWHLPAGELGKKRATLRRVVLEVAQPYPNHNAGQLAFGPDGFLYIGLGDGGAGGDPLGHGQKLSTLLGTMLRIDVSSRRGDRPYANPSDNPFVGRPGARPEIWAYGLRNPWKFSFDPRGRLLVADVGQNAFEEIDIVTRGANLGWNVREGRHCFGDEKCSAKGFTEPIFEYERSLGLSVTGGFVYTGKELPELAGKYVFADYVTGNVWALSLPDASGDRGRATLLGRWPRSIATFGRDAKGEIYAGDFASGDLLHLTRR